jgi:hypothetical protein
MTDDDIKRAVELAKDGLPLMQFRSGDVVDASDTSLASDYEDAVGLLARALLHLHARCEAMKKESFDLRTALIDVCDRYYSHRDERTGIRRLRAAANNLAAPFDYATAMQPPPCQHIEIVFGGEMGNAADCLRCRDAARPNGGE